MFGFMAGWLTVSLLSVSRDSECRPRPAGTGQLAPFSAVPLDHPCFGTARSEERKKRKKTGADNPCAERYRDRARGARLGGSVESVTRLAESCMTICEGQNASRQGADHRQPPKFDKPRARRLLDRGRLTQEVVARSFQQRPPSAATRAFCALLCTAPSHIAHAQQQQQPTRRPRLHRHTQHRTSSP
eukprot:COSAG06_NODE_4401_length_4294_cov_177.030989_3_plen_187_part_00